MCPGGRASPAQHRRKPALVRPAGSLLHDRSLSRFRRTAVQDRGTIVVGFWQGPSSWSIAGAFSLHPHVWKGLGPLWGLTHQGPTSGHRHLPKAIIFGVRISTYGFGGDKDIPATSKSWGWAFHRGAGSAFSHLQPALRPGQGHGQSALGRSKTVSHQRHIKTSESLGAAGTRELPSPSSYGRGPRVPSS